LELKATSLTNGGRIWAKWVLLLILSPTRLKIYGYGLKDPNGGTTRSYTTIFGKSRIIFHV